MTPASEGSHAATLPAKADTPACGTVRLLYLFSGPAERPDGFKQAAEVAGRESGATCSVVYMGLENGPEEDVFE